MCWYDFNLYGCIPLLFYCFITCFGFISRKSKKARKKIEKGSDVLDKSSKRDGSSDSQSRRKRSRLTNSENDDSFLPRMDIRIAIPQELQHWLVDDWDLITRQKQLVPLPRKKTVHHILQDYIQSVVDNPNGVRPGVAAEMTQGIKEYFNVMLGTQLLYKFERPQYGDLLNDMPSKSMCEIYGVEHLLRLFIRLGSALSYSNFDEKSMQFVVSCIQDFLNYLSREADVLFSPDYVNATPEYHRRATT
jgi:mortality factor 4-like protein 1